MAIVTLSDGQIISLQDNLEIAKFLLFTVPKIGSSEVIGDLPQLVMDERVSKLLKISGKLRANRIQRIREAMMNEGYDLEGFDDDIPF